ncbi:MAG: hypothetical protein AAB896_03335 [Patescibacteria group bacterium]
MDQKNAGPTVFDINKPHTYGASPSARPVIVGHRPTMPDPMVTPQEVPPLGGPKISVKVNESSNPLATMEGEPQLSPPFKPDVDSESAAQRAPYMPVSDLTGINQNQPSSILKPTRASEISDDQVVTTNPKPSVYGSSNHTPVNEGNAPKHRRSHTKLWLLPLFILILLAGAYAAIDKGLILSNINLPFHIFKKTDTVATSPQSSSATQTSIPSGFTSTKLIEANLGFAYPTDWGAPTASTDLGFSKRSSAAKADANYAFLVSFPNNKDVQLAITSAKFLPPARTAQYYDFLGWCVGTVDAKYYAGVLRYSTIEGVDSPMTVTCDQGPLNNAVKIISDTIVQTNIKNTDGSLMGDIYTKNLSNNDYVVARAKDATMKNGDLIQTMLGTIQNSQ